MYPNRLRIDADGMILPEKRRVWCGKKWTACWPAMLAASRALPHHEDLDDELERAGAASSRGYFLPGFCPHAALYLGTTEELERMGIPVPAETTEGPWFLLIKEGRRAGPACR